MADGPDPLDYAGTTPVDVEASSTDANPTAADLPSFPSPHRPDVVMPEQQLQAQEYHEDDGRVFLVPHRWFRQSQQDASSSLTNPSDAVPKGILYSASSATYAGPMKIINSFFNSDIIFDLRQADDQPSSSSSTSSSSLSSSSGETDSVATSSSGRCYALIRTDLWSYALKWHGETSLLHGTGNSSLSEGATRDVYAISLRISVVQESKTMTIKISKRDNHVEYFRRASKIFSLDSEPVHIWDYSGQTTLIFMDKENKLHRDAQQIADQEIILVLHIYALSEPVTSREGKKDDTGTRLHKKLLSSGNLLLCNGSKRTEDSDCNDDYTTALSGRYQKVGSLGMTGLENLGNTCFMNSAIQCLAHTPKLVEYFIGNYHKELNYDNPLGMRGELAIAFGELLRELWAPDRSPVVPKLFKAKLAHFAPQFSGFNQHDSQELLAFLLDGLHEDLNRVKRKPYVEVKDVPGRSDEELANEYWENHLARNDSIIVDLCQGQYRSKLVCPICSKTSLTFDPFMYLSLPLPSTSMRTMTLTVFSMDGIMKSSVYTIKVPKYGKCKDLIQSLSSACSLRDDESILIAEVYNNRIIRYLEEPSDYLPLIRDGDKLAAYRLSKDLESFPLVVFMHQHMAEQVLRGRLTSYSNPMIFPPLVTRLSESCNESNISNLFLKLLNPFRGSDSAHVGDQDIAGSGSSNEMTAIDVISELPDVDATNTTTKRSILNEFRFYLTDERGSKIDAEIEADGKISIPGIKKQLHVLVHWSEEAIEKHEKCFLKSLPIIHKSEFSFSKRPQNFVSLYGCLDAFLKEEPLGPEDMWYCPSCKVHQQATKKLDLWRLPDILVIHLKRFSYNRFMENKLETFVDFPVHDLDLSTYIASNSLRQSNCYELFAMSNHYGSMGGGHYTAYVHCKFSSIPIDDLKKLRSLSNLFLQHAGTNEWYDFDDRHVSCISQDNIKTSAAYVLFYKRIHSDDMDVVQRAAV